MERRAALRNISGLLLTPALTLPAVSADRTSVLRIAHLTDIHLKNKFDAPKRFERCLHHVQKQSPKVDLILNGDDVVFDMNKENLATIDEQWKLMKGIMASECSIPVNYCLGNHDIWWNENDKGQALYGKKYSMDKLHLSKPYYSLSKNGWKIIVLDSVHLDVDDPGTLANLATSSLIGWSRN
jgi:Icc protein